MEARDVMDRVRRERDGLRRYVCAALTAATDALGETAYDDDGRLHVHAEQLQHAMVRYIDLEDELVPAVLFVMDVWGPARVDRLLAQHRARRATLRAAVEAIERRPHAREVLAGTLCELAAQVLLTIAEEEDTLVFEDALSPSVVNVDEFGG